MEILSDNIAGNILVAAEFPGGDVFLPGEKAEIVLGVRSQLGSRRKQNVLLALKNLDRFSLRVDHVCRVFPICIR